MKRDDIAETVQLYDWLRLHGREEEAEALFRLYPSLLDYDASGNYVGQVRHENGWTP